MHILEESSTSKFCINGEVPLVCKQPRFDEFEDEIEIIVLILHYLKSYLPIVMSKKKDCRGRNIKIDPKDIGLTTQKDYGDYIIILVPTDDNSSYPDDNLMREQSEYVFQLQLHTSDDDSEGALENLIKLKSGIKTMLINMDYNIGLNTTIDGFSFDGPFPIEENNKYVREGTYTFSVIDNRYKK